MPRRSPIRAWTFILTMLLAVILATGDPAIAAVHPKTEPLALADAMPSWDKIRATAASLWKKPQAGTDPLSYFIDPLGREMGLSDAASTLAVKKLPPALATELKVTELADTARRLIRNLAAWNLATAARAVAQAKQDTPLEPLLAEIREQATWLTEGEEMPYVRSILASMPALKSNGAATDAATDETLYREYAAFLDVRYPAIANTADSWLAVLETGGIQAWRDRLAAAPDKIRADETDLQGLADRYSASRLRPVLQLHLSQLGSQLETWAAQRVYRTWLSIYQWKDSVRLARGMARLCGSWQWTIHNHQNHGEQKLIVSFPPPGAVPEQGGPAEIVALGDLIYLRWEGGGRVQEDSLLFSKEGQRLEGTFINNAGGWGSVTGKRTAGCGKK